MVKLLNKLLIILKNILLPITLFASIYIVIFMFKRLDKDVFGQNLMEFLAIVFPYFLLLILNIVNIFLKQKSVNDNLFYNATSFFVSITILIFCYRALFDKNMFLWYKYGYNINYFSDQIAAIKVMLYGLSIGNILLMISNYLQDNKNE